MNITRKNNILLLFLLACSISCRLKSNDNKPKETQISFSKEWKTDTLGCLGIREKIINDSLKTIQKIIGITENNFIKIFGKPNHIKANERNKIYLYWVTCGIIPPIKSNDKKSSINPIKGIDMEATRMLVEFDNKNIVKKIKVILP